MPDLPDLPLLEDDLARPGVLEPERVVRSRDLPERAVLCFPRQPVEAAGKLDGAVRRDPVVAEHGHHAVWDVPWKGQRLAVVQAAVGAPMAAGVLEEVVARGVRAVVAVGGAGALLPDLVMGHPVVVTSAVRDEGTSFHYAPPARTIDADPEGVAVWSGCWGRRGRRTCSVGRGPRTPSSARPASGSSAGWPRAARWWRWRRRP